MKESEILVLVQSIEQPRVIKRIIELTEIYNKVYILGFSRSFYRDINSSLFANYSSIEILKLKSIPNRNFFFRVVYYFYFLFLLNFQFKKFNNIYCFGLDSRLLVFFSNNSKVIYEISDISWLYFSRPFKFFFSKLDYFLANLSYKVVFTSTGFYESYYSHLPLQRVLIKENRFRSFNKVQPILKLKSDVVRVAYVGAFRYTDIIKILINYFKNNPEKELRFYGDGYEDVVNFIKKHSEKYPNIYFFGPFKNPDHLEKIYSQNNINFVAYDNSLDNEKVAMPNKFYESGFFNIPIVVSKGTYVAQRVQEVKLGWCIEPNDEGIKMFFDSLSVSHLLKAHEQIKLLDKKQFYED
ncbi:hypothetical protein SAMN04488057_10629 [Cyclobacterium lianum]|uniref:Uncharacterized protein n=1 Tax=Cyclobacterium lianum TaxID=388280 RepID=A0A1M7NSI3_9BACT|nr:hypothetical protein [Cyclobacterium lianum]SHN06865.1 hypothetical protein SAMN04488057_10629 [Cyclobacterium lianum]